jgi:flagellar basal-body rod protein FlgB
VRVVNPVYLFDLASRHVAWASLRQTVVAGNIANANTPGYGALDVEPFADVLSETGLVMAQTTAGHISVTGAEARAGKTEPAESWDVTLSGNSVSLDDELIKAGEVNRAVALDTSIERSFHRMLMMSVRGA